jgi:hypothetical protein
LEISVEDWEALLKENLNINIFLNAFKIGNLRATKECEVNMDEFF